jgi:hypothetical protein
MKIDLSRRFFLFGATATLILPPERTFHILSPPKLIANHLRIILPGGKLFDLPNPQSNSIGRKLVDGTYKMSDIPRWVVLDKQWYDDMITIERRTA